jgi:DNA repair exonuclease SbcCD ATPase subunit
MAKYILEIDVDEKGAVQGINKVESELKGLNKETQKMGKEGKAGFSFLEKASPRAAAAVRGVTGSITGLASGFKTLRAAIISTGIGALVVALGSLVAYFTQTKKGAELLERATSGLSAVFSVLVDLASSIGESLVNAFQNPQKAVKDLWEAVKTNIVNRFEGLKNQVIAFGKILESAFSLDWEGVKQGAEDYARSLVQVATGLDKEQQDALAKSIAGVASEMDEAARKAIALTKAEQELRDLTRELNIETAKRRSEIKKLNKDAEDTTKSYKEREEAARKAGELEQDLMSQRVAAAEENLRIIKERNALSNSMDKDLDAEAEAEIELYRIREESYELQTTLQNKLNTLRQQRSQEYQNTIKKNIDERNKLNEEFTSQQIERDKALAEEQKKILKDVESVRDFLESKRIQTEEEQINAKYERLREQANGELELLKELQIQQNYELGKLQEDALIKQDEEARKKRDEELADYKRTQKAKVDFAMQTANSLIGIGELLAGSSESSARKIFAVNKAVGIAGALVDTFRAANKVLADWPTPGPARFAAMAATITTGIANVAKIASTKFSSSTSGGGGGSRPSVGGSATASAPQPTAAIDFGFLNQQNNQQAIPAYVLEGQAMNQQEASMRVKDLTTL